MRFYLSPKINTQQLNEASSKCLLLTLKFVKMITAQLKKILDKIFSCPSYGHVARKNYDWLKKYRIKKEGYAVKGRQETMGGSNQVKSEAKRCYKKLGKEQTGLEGNFNEPSNTCQCIEWI